MSDWLPSALSKVGFEFLLADLDTALTFLKVAESAIDADTRERNHANARRAYDTVVRLMQNLSLDDIQSEELAQKLALLKTRLQDVGQQF
jgi:hypothetical protein